MRREFDERGCLHLGPSYHENGRERRKLLSCGDRKTVYRELEEIEVAHGADISLEGITSVRSNSVERSALSTNRLSVRQREAFSLARDRGYYEYPREVDTRRSQKSSA